jgi:hypothetical protein
LPTVETIEPVAGDIGRLPLARLGRVAAAKLDDANLIKLFRRSLLMGMRRTTAQFAAEVVRRPSLEGQDDAITARRTLVSYAPDSDTALVEIIAAREAAEKAHQSTSPWDLEELRLRLLLNDQARALALVRQLSARQNREPDVAVALMRLLQEFGIVGGPSGGASLPPAEEPSSILVPGGTAEPGKLVLPGGEAAAPGGRGSKPAIWTPGMS